MGLIARLKNLFKKQGKDNSDPPEATNVSPPENSTQQQSAGTHNTIIQVGNDSRAPITINQDPLAQKALDALTKKLDKQEQAHQLSLAEKDQQIKTLHEIILNLSQSKQNHSLPALQVDSALQAIIDSGDTAQAKALLSQKIDANAKALQQAQQQLIEQQNQLTEQRQQQAELYFQRGVLAFNDDTHGALADFIQACELHPDYAEAWNLVGLLNQRLGQLDQAISAFQKVQQLGKQQSEQELIAIALGNIGLVYRIRGELDKALAMHQQALDISQALGRKEGMANQYCNMGNVYQYRRELDKALAMYQRSLDISQELGRKGGMANQYGNMGNVYQTCGELDEALAMYQRALDIFEALNYKEHMASAYGNMGVVYQTRGELDKALEMYQQALDINQTLGRKEGMASDYGNIGLVYETQGDMAKAKALWQQSLALFTEVGAKPQIEQTQRNLDNLEVELAGD